MNAKPRKTIALVSCGKRKLAVPAKARDLYVSHLFQAMRLYAETHSDRWYILSAKFGLLKPTQVVRPYDSTLQDMSASVRRTWAAAVSDDLRRILPPHARVLLLAGRRYRADLEPFLIAHDVPVRVPMRGLPTGKQLQWLKRANARPAERP